MSTYNICFYLFIYLLFFFLENLINCVGVKRQHLRVILCLLPENGRRETGKIVEKMKERDGGERGK